MLNLKPLGERVILKVTAPEEVTASGIIIPSTAQEAGNKGTVVAVGQKTDGSALSVKVNDEVLFTKHAGVGVKIQNEAYLILDESDLLAVL